jgi:hypothetical protein
MIFARTNAPSLDDCATHSTASLSDDVCRVRRTVFALFAFVMTFTVLVTFAAVKTAVAEDVWSPSAGGMFMSSLVEEESVNDEPLPPLDEELANHGSYLYETPEPGLGFESHAGASDHAQYLRLPEWYEGAQPPLTAYQDFMGADEVKSNLGLKWFGDDGFQWEPRFTGYGSWQMFGMLLEQGGTRQDTVGNQIVIDLDLRLTGTERAHVQFRPLGRRNTGGSYYQFNDPSRYVDHSTGIPDRWWIEGEVFSVFSRFLPDEFTPLDYHITLGKVPFAVHNSLLINDEVTGVIVTKNTLIIPPLSNLNLQGFYFIDDVDTATPNSTELVGVHAQADWRHAFLEATLAYVKHSADHNFDARYVAMSATKFFGPLSLASRAMFKHGDNGGTGDGELFVVESNFSRTMPESVTCATGIETAVVYANVFHATNGWSPISGGNFNRLRSTFAVDPLVRIGQGFNPAETTGVSLGVELFRHHEDEQIIPEIAYEELRGEPVWGVGVRWLRKLGPQMYLDASGVIAESATEAFDREGVFVSTFFVF